MAEPMRTSHIDDVEGFIPDDSTFGARLALVRQWLRFNIKEAAEKAGVSPQQWGRWEEGQSPRNYPDVVTKISQRLGVNEVWLSTGVRTGRMSPLIGIDGPPQLPLPFPVERSFCLVEDREPVTC